MGQHEYSVIDYTMQRHRTFKALALAYCLLWNRLYISSFIKRVQADIQGGGDARGLPELHATLSGMKVGYQSLQFPAIPWGSCRILSDPL
jgi:hypothetical protein